MLFSNLAGSKKLASVPSGGGAAAPAAAAGGGGSAPAEAKEGWLSSHYCFIS